MTPDQIQNKLNLLQAELDALKSNLSEIPNSCDHYIPQPGEVVLIYDDGDDFEPRIFLKYNKGTNEPFECVAKGHEGEYRNGEPYKTITWKFCRRISGEIIEFGCDKYTHLLPTGYEFCTEEQAEKWVKVKLVQDGKNELPLGATVPDCTHVESLYRPIRPIQYHVAVHEAVTAEPNPYAVDWANAPEWADVHCYDERGTGLFYGAEPRDNQYIPRWRCSGFTLPTGLDWKQSKTVRPK